MQSIELGNIVLILVGIVLVVVAFVILYRTGRGLLRKKAPDQKNFALYVASELLNLVIGVVFLVAGVLFVLNNLRGNPIPSSHKSGQLLHFESKTKS
jgi:uncharacterized membrane protein YidH (DUF202 family)